MYVGIEPADDVSEEAIGGLALGSQEFESFYRANERRLYGTLCVVTGDPREAEELLQEAFLRVWERWDRVSVMDDPAGYLFRTAFNLFRSRMRRLLRAARRTVLPVLRPSPSDQIDERMDLLAALRRLTPRQRAAVVLLDLMDLPSEEAGEILGVKAVTVRTLASQARHALRAEVEDRDG
jgi:RNA polymerase sigma-70 factor, ECF subfamily